MPDAAAYGDAGSDTLGNIARQRRAAAAEPVRARPGEHTAVREPAAAPKRPPAAYGRCALASPGKDTTTGHWEIAGIHLPKPFPLYPHGFPPEVLGEFERRTGAAVLGNCPASGTEIIERLGEEHLRTGSADCLHLGGQRVSNRGARGSHSAPGALPHVRDRARNPARAARSGARDRAAIRRQARRVSPRQRRAPRLRRAAARGHAARPAGRARACRCFGRQDRRHFSRPRHHAIRSRPGTTPKAWRRRSKRWTESERGFIFVNLVDFDMLYGHRNDVEGYAAALEAPMRGSRR